MRPAPAHLLPVLIALPFAAAAQAEIPEWVKSNAGWWADGSIDDATFVGAIGFLVGAGIIEVSPAEAATEAPDGIPEWVKSNAGWWADGSIDDATFVGAIEFLVGAGIIAVGGGEAMGEAMGEAPAAESGGALQAELEACAEIKKARDRVACEDEVEWRIKVAWYKASSEAYEVGPITYYYPGLGTDGNSFYMQGEQPILDVTMLAINERGAENVALSCTSPSVCGYDVFDGSRAFKYAGTDFTSGQHVIRPGEAREFNILFGPNIGYGGTQLEYDASRDYTFRIKEAFGGADVPLDLQ
ncbi:MAG: peptidase [Thaumarchaeota archaeon S13]|nr:MAG: peptidase [Thaumarchaeota archaeon S13]